MGGMYPPPTFLGGGDGLYKHPPPPLFEDKIILNLTFIVKKLTFLTVKLLKNSKNRSLAPLARTQMYSETRSLRFCQYMYSFLDIIYVKKGVEYWKQTLCNSMARKSIAGLPIIQVKGTWRFQGGIILGSRKNHQWLKSEIPHWNIVHVVSFALSHALVHIKQYFWNLIYKMYFILPVWCK